MSANNKTRCRWLCCCCGCCDTSSARGRRFTRSGAEYLLPKDDWFHVGSSSPSQGRGSTGSTGSTSSSNGRSLSGSGAICPNRSYDPPRVPLLQSMPSIDDFKLLKTLGKGAFGKVFLSVHTPTKVLYALKVVPKSKIATPKQKKQVQTELEILKKIRHPFCISLQYAFQDQSFLFYVFEFAVGGMLFYHLRQEGKFTEQRSRFYFGEIVLALEYLHCFGIIFRDLKPENCMLSQEGHIRLTDFGSAKLLKGDDTRTTTLAGTPQYIAPEVLRGESYTFSADWWSCGILLHEMLVGKPPFQSSDRVELYRKVLSGEFRVPFTMSPRAKSLICRLVNKDPELRLGGSTTQMHSGEEIKEHCFFSQAPSDPDEEAQLATEEAERERHLEALERSRQQHSGPIGTLTHSAGRAIRSFSITASHRLSRISSNCIPCEWSWSQLEHREVVPPFQPYLTSVTDTRHFDISATSSPPLLLQQSDRLLSPSSSSSSVIVGHGGPKRTRSLPSGSNPSPTDGGKREGGEEGEEEFKDFTFVGSAASKAEAQVEATAPTSKASTDSIG